MRTTAKITDLFQEGVQYLKAALSVADCYTLGEVKSSVTRGKKACIHIPL